MLESGKIHLRGNILAVFFTMLLFISTAERAGIQPPRFSIELQLTQTLQDGENIDFTNLFTPSGQGRMLYSFDIINENQPDVDPPGRDDDDEDYEDDDDEEDEDEEDDDDDEEDEDDDRDKIFSRYKLKRKEHKLYLHIRFYTDRDGTISEINQKDKKGFKTDNGQRIHIGNQMLGGSLPGIKEKIEFEGGLTMAGQNLLKGKRRGTLPPAHYTIEVQLYKKRNKPRGGELLAAETADFTVHADEQQNGDDEPMENGEDNPPDENGGEHDDSNTNPGGGNTGKDGNNDGWDEPDPDTGTGDQGEGKGNGVTDEFTPGMNRRARGSSIYLSSPGGEGRNPNEVNNPYPEFRWDGPMGYSYRLVIVKEKSNESPESLIQGALSTAAFIVKNRAGQGKLLDYEVVDAIINRPAFQFPTSGVQPLEADARYYWQVLLDKGGSENTGEAVRSEIWSFRLAAGAQNTVAYSGELADILIEMLGERDYHNLRRDGFKLLSITVDGKTLTGQAALRRLSRLKSKVDQGKITLENKY